MILIVVLIAVGILLEVLFFAVMWPPWRKQMPSIAWLLAGISAALAAYDLLILLATLKIRVSPFLALAVLLGKDAILAWRFRVALDFRRPIRTNVTKRGGKSMNEILQLIPAHIRKWVYASLALGALIYSVWMAAGGNWQVALGSLVTTILGTMAQANVKPDPPTSQGELVPPHAETYE